MEGASQNILRVENLSVSLDGFSILEYVSFNVPKGTITAIIGPNGAGKTTLFRALLGLIPYRGELRWQKGIRIGYVPQKFTIDRDMPLTVNDFFELKTRNIDKVFEALRLVGISQDEHHVRHHILERRIGVLSGGEFQKVSIAWALIDDPDVLLFDEPTAGIDAGSEETIYMLIRRIRDEKGLTVLFISHELSITYQYADQVVCLNKKMICQGHPKQVLDNKVLQELYGAHAGVYQHKEG